MAAKKRWTERRVLDVLEKRRFPAPAWALLRQVADATGWGQKRWADGVAMSLWPSRGLELHGIEAKVSRSDWRRELEKPDKAEAVAAYCDRWWIAAPTGVVPVEELPPAWGLLEVEEDKVTAARQAEKLEAAPLTREFIASMIRRTHETTTAALQRAVRREDIAEELEKARKEGVERGKADASHELRMLEQLRAAVLEFEQASGVQLNVYQAGRIGGAVRRVLAVTDAGRSVEQTLAMAERQLERTLQQLRDARAQAAKEAA